MLVHVKDSRPFKDPQYCFAVICLIAITYSLLYILSKTCQCTLGFFPPPGFKCALSLFHSLLVLSWVIHGFSRSFLLIKCPACQRAGQASWSLRKEEPGAERNKVDRAKAQSLLGSAVSELALSRASQTSRRWGALSSFPVLSQVFHQKSLVLGTSDNLPVLLQRLSSLPSEPLAHSVSPSQIRATCFSVP